MTISRFPGPDTARTLQQHVCALSGRAEALRDAIEPQPALLQELRSRHVLSIRDFDAPILKQLFREAAEYETSATGEKPAQGRILSNIYFDHSRERTRLSFNTAWLRLGGSLLNFERSLDEIISKRHAPAEIAEICSNYSDIAVLRTMESESLEEILQFIRVPVINAGNGADEHPTHAMADLYTLFKWRPELLADNVPAELRLNIAIAGDPAVTRTLRSLLFGLALFPQAVEKIVILGPHGNSLAKDQQEVLEQSGIRVEMASDQYPKETALGIAKAVLPETDLVYVHYLHPVHASRMALLEAIEHLKQDAMVLNPQVHDEKFPQLLNDSPHNGYFAQAQGSVYIHMALYASLLGKD
jgi:aspartate carbamoyltransferase catalytic subunit